MEKFEAELARRAAEEKARIKAQADAGLTAHSFYAPRNADAVRRANAAAARTGGAGSSSSHSLQVLEGMDVAPFPDECCLAHVNASLHPQLTLSSSSLSPFIHSIWASPLSASASSSHPTLTTAEWKQHASVLTPLSTSIHQRLGTVSSAPILVEDTHSTSAPPPATRRYYSYLC